MATKPAVLFSVKNLTVEIAVDGEWKGFPPEVRIEITHNGAPRIWLRPDDAREIAEQLIEAAEIAEKATASADK